LTNPKLAGRFDETTFVPDKRRLDHIPPNPPNLRKGGFLGALHHGGVVDHVGPPK
jgi:hypothetical protein